MFFTAAHESKHTRRACQICRDRKARFRYRGEVRADRDHVLCFACYRSAHDRRRAQLLAEVPAAPPLRLSEEKRSLSGAQVAHRRRMLAHLSGRPPRQAS